MKAPVASVLMITYQHAPFIAQAIESILRQRTQFAFEIVIGVDVGSDDTLAIVEAFRKAHPEAIHVITSTRNVGAVENFRRTALACRGRFIALCEGDDYWLSDQKLQDQIDVLTSRSEVSSVFTDFVMTHWRDGRWVVDQASALSKVDLTSLRGSLKGLPQAGMLRTLTGAHRSEVLTGLFGRDLPLSEYPFADSFLVGEAMQQGQIEILPFVSAVYRVSPSSSTRGTPEANVRLLEKLRDFQSRFEQFFPQLGPPDPHRVRDTDIAICRAAYLANDAQAFERAFLRICTLGLPVPSQLHVLRRLLDWPLLRAATLAAGRLRQRSAAADG